MQIYRFITYECRCNYLCPASGLKHSAFTALVCASVMYLLLWKMAECYASNIKRISNIRRMAKSHFSACSSSPVRSLAIFSFCCCHACAAILYPLRSMNMNSCRKSDEYKRKKLDIHPFWAVNWMGPRQNYPSLLYMLKQK